MVFHRIPQDAFKEKKYTVRYLFWVVADILKIHTKFFSPDNHIFVQ